jgi:hypothetical protein
MHWSSRIRRARAPRARRRHRYAKRGPPSPPLRNRKNFCRSRNKPRPKLNNDLITAKSQSFDTVCPGIGERGSPPRQALTFDLRVNRPEVSHASKAGHSPRSSRELSPAPVPPFSDACLRLSAGLVARSPKCAMGRAKVTVIAAFERNPAPRAMPWCCLYFAPRGVSRRPEISRPRPQFRAINSTLTRRDDGVFALPQAILSGGTFRSFEGLGDWPHQRSRGLASIRGQLGWT